MSLKWGPKDPSDHGHFGRDLYEKGTPKGGPMDPFSWGSIKKRHFPIWGMVSSSKKPFFERVYSVYKERTPKGVLPGLKGPYVTAKLAVFTA